MARTTKPKTRANRRDRRLAKQSRWTRGMKRKMGVHAHGETGAHTIRNSAKPKWRRPKRRVVPTVDDSRTRTDLISTLWEGAAAMLDLARELQRVEDDE